MLEGIDLWTQWFKTIFDAEREQKTCTEGAAGCQGPVGADKLIENDARAWREF